jgi:GNAT superfamily N-acetyltransferase
MNEDASDLPPELRLSHDGAPSIETRRLLGEAIDAFNARTVPQDTRRFALLLRDRDDRLVAGLSGVVAWQWLFVQALWVDDEWRRRRVGSALMQRAEAIARDAGCHSAWLDSFQARDFYLGLGYEVFGALEDYPVGQTRYFLRKSLA